MGAVNFAFESPLPKPRSSAIGFGSSNRCPGIVISSDDDTLYERWAG